MNNSEGRHGLNVNIILNNSSNQMNALWALPELFCPAPSSSQWSFLWEEQQEVVLCVSLQGGHWPVCPLESWGMEFQAGKQSWSAGELLGTIVWWLSWHTPAGTRSRGMREGESWSDPSGQSSHGIAGLDLLFLGAFRDFGIWEMRASIPILVLILLQGEF